MKKKVIAICLTLALAATAVVGGTLAYFTDDETKENTFSVGALDISLEEPSWKEDSGKNIVPGDSVAKDPAVTVTAGSVDCFVRVTVTMPTSVYDASDFFHENADALIAFREQSEDFSPVGAPIVDAEKKTTTVVLKYKEEVTDTAEAVPLGALFTSVDFDGAIDDESDLYKSMAAGDWAIVVKAYAVQSANTGTEPGTKDESNAFKSAFGDIFKV